MSEHILSDCPSFIEFLNELRKRDKMGGFAKLFTAFFTMCLISVIIQEHEC